MTRSLYPVALVASLALVVLEGPSAATEIELPRIQIPAAYDRLWLAEVEIWMTAEERAVYTSALTPDQRELFRREFWRARDATPRSALNEVKEHAFHQLGSARQRGLAPEDPRFRAISLFGSPPFRMVHGDCNSPSSRELSSICVIAPPFELFDYGNQAPPGMAPLLFVRHPNESLGPCVLYREDLRPPFRLKRTAPQVCNSNSYLLGRAEEALGFSYSWGQLLELGFQAPPTRSWARAWADREGSAVVEGGQAPRLHLAGAEQVELEDPQGSEMPVVYRLDLRASFPLPKGWWRRDLAWRNVSFRLDVIKDDELVWSNDSVRTELGDPGDELELTWSLQVPEGPFQLVAHAEDEAAELFLTGAWQVEVPADTNDVSAPDTSVDAEPGSAEDSGAFVESVLTHPWALLPSLDGAWFGLREVELDSWSPTVASVSYYLADRRVGGSSAAPFSAIIDFGPTPRQWTLQVEAFSAAGELLATDEVLVNRGAHRFALELEQLEVTRQGSVNVRGRVVVPAGGRIESVRVLDSEGATLLASNEDTFLLSHQLALDEAGRVEPRVLTASVVLDDGRRRDESLLIGAEESMEVDVELVELFASITDRRGRPITDLDVSEVVVREDEVPQRVGVFRRVEELPINVVLLLDTSSSMSDDIDEVRASGLQFLDQVIRADDLASIVSFSHRAYVVAPLTSDLEALAEGSRALRTWGGTSFYDSLMLALYSLQGLEGKRAVIVVSDGADQDSRVGADELLEYAERSNAAVYTISLGSADIAGGARQARQDLRTIAERTGGAAFSIRSSARLSSVYREIEADLRSQYLVAYQSDASARGREGHDYRPIRVEVARRGARVRARPGYYP